MALRDTRNAEVVAALAGGALPGMLTPSSGAEHQAELLSTAGLWLSHLDTVLQGAAQSTGLILAGESVLVSPQVGSGDASPNCPAANRSECLSHVS